MAEKVRRQLGVALDRELRERLEAAANKAGHSIAEEIRRRIATDETLTPELRELFEVVRATAQKVDRHVGGPWSDGNHAIEILAEAIKVLVLAFRPAAPAEAGHAVYDLLGDPKIVGETLGREVLLDLLREGHFPHLQQASERRHKRTMRSTFIKEKKP